ncbi:MAG: hypothetical protein AB7G28_14145 [Pirellulales bacterium]
MSMFFGLLTVALCVLWVRSYSWYDYDYLPLTASTEAHLSSFAGGVAVALSQRDSRREVSMAIGKEVVSK